MSLLLKIRTFIARRGLWLQGMIQPEQAWILLRSIWPKVTEHSLLRVGGDGDGGYLIPESQIDKIQAIFSPGVSDVANFELYFADRGIRCHLADGSVESPPFSHDNFLFSKRMIGLETIDFQNNISLGNWIKASGEESDDLLLQMDIEGSEYEALIDADREILAKFRVIVVELHGLHSLVTKAGYRLIALALSKLLEEHVSLHLHVNNASDGLTLGDFTFPDTLELTLIRKDLVAEIREEYATLPHALDRPNTSKPDWHLSLIR